jgi:hypothetical protein
MVHSTGFGGMSKAVSQRYFDQTERFVDSNGAKSWQVVSGYRIKHQIL